MNKVLHYIHDPLCGWCYAAEQLVDAVHARAQGQFGIQLHAGGLFSRSRLSDAKRSHIRSADARIGELTGQVFGDAYLNGLLSAPDTVYDSIVPIRGILAAEMVRPEGGLPMLKSLQRAHYRSGLRIVEPATIADVAESSGFDKVQFAAAFQCISAAELQQHLDKTHRLMQVVGAHGYPTFVAQIGNKFQLLQHDRFYGNPNGFGDFVSNILAPQTQAGGRMTMSRLRTAGLDNVRAIRASSELIADMSFSEACKWLTSCMDEGIRESSVTKRRT